MESITFTVTPCEETGGYVAVWDAAPGQGGIATQGDSLAELNGMVADAVRGWFADKGFLPPCEIALR